MLYVLLFYSPRKTSVDTVNTVQKLILGGCSSKAIWRPVFRGHEPKTQIIRNLTVEISGQLIIADVGTRIIIN